VTNPWRAVVSLALVATAGGAATEAFEANAAGATASTIYVASGASGGSGHSCGTARYATITIVGHKAGAVDSSGTLHPKVAGVYDNVVSQNTVTNNGTVGTGGGILLANPRAGMATYKNTIRGNTVARNGLAGITLNENTTGQYLDGNAVVGNTVGTNNLLGSQTAGNGATTAISVYVADGARPVRVAIGDNAISANAYGIYGGKGTVLTQSGNTFDGVTTSVYVAT